jgi:hypothetical protein
MAHIEESTETEADFAVDEKENEKESTINETEASSSSSPEKKRPAPDDWEDESSLNHRNNDVNPQVAKYSETKEAGEETLSDDKRDMPSHNLKGNDHQLSANTSSTSPIVPRKPVKKARTAYFIFAEEKRPELQEQVCVCYCCRE